MAGEDETILRIREFKSDLLRLKTSEVVRKHITVGGTVIIKQSEYYELRTEVAQHFGLHPASVVLVGSCRLGFSLKEKKRYTAASASADFDLALVSANRFDEYWDLVFDYARSDRNWAKTKSGKHFTRMLFNGWLDPRGLPDVDRFDIAKKWAEFFDKLMNSRRYGRRRITARLYRTWDRLEKYQAINVESCQIAARSDQNDETAKGQ